MSEIRENKATQDWVIIATERAKRPLDYKKENTKKVIPEYDPNCPFCQGNEDKTPASIFEIKQDNKWIIRSVLNKFSALNKIKNKIINTTPLYTTCAGHGVHEVLIESPKHNNTISSFNDSQMKNIISSYKQRYNSITKDKNIELITMFRNYGISAGSSLIHPHSQIIATPVIPPSVRHRLYEATLHYDRYGSCIYCDMIKDEIEKKVRVISENEHFTAFVLYAALSPFHTWIIPKRHQSCFSEISKDEIASLSQILQSTLKKIDIGLGNPDYNYVIRSAPIGLEKNKYYHWYLSIILRLTKAAGFELGSGMFINSSLPKDNAEFLRNIKI